MSDKSQLPIDDDMLLLCGAFFQNLRRDNCEYGGVGIDGKRPFGNSDVEGDILEIFGAEPEGVDDGRPCWSEEQREYAAAAYDQLIPYLQNLFFEEKKRP